MENPRDVFLHYARSKRGFNIDEIHTSAHVRESLVEAMFYTIVDYIDHERNNDENGVGKLERLYSYPIDFLKVEDPYEWLEENRPSDDIGLIVYIHDNIYEMTPGKHRRSLLYIINMLNFDL